MVQRPSVGDYVTNIRNHAPRMISGISELAKIEMKSSAKAAGVGAGAMGAAAVIGLTVLRLLMIACCLAAAIFFHYVLNLNLLLALTLGFLSMAVLFLIIAIILAMIGKGQFGKVKAPEATIAEAKTSMATLGDSISAGVNDAKMGVVDRLSVASPNPTTKSSATEARYAADPKLVEAQRLLDEA